MFAPSVILIAIALVAVGTNLEAIQSAVYGFYSYFVGNFSWVFILPDPAALAFAVWAIFGPCAKARISDKDASADFSLFAWVAIMFTTSCGAGLI
ncbi:BCCT family transporter [Paraeggerthella sp.]|uniref:BCCT family transporter n=1 Tax=Paraeggerthella sp. TaxID=2897350 RepID=UPI0015F0894A